MAANAVAFWRRSCSVRTGVTAKSSKRSIVRWPVAEIRTELTANGFRSFVFDPEVGVRDASKMDNGVIAVASDGSELRGTEAHSTIHAASLFERAWTGAGKRLPAIHWQGTRAIFTCDIH
jgi:hypothetical protein